MMAEVSQLHIYPVKSLRGIVLREAELGIGGLQYDRHWMVTDGAGNFLTQRQIPKMATVGVAIDGPMLKLHTPGQRPLHVPLDGQPPRPVRVQVWNEACEATDEGEEAAQWLTRTLGTWHEQPLRLVRIARGFQRPVEPDSRGAAQAHTAFADAYPYLVASQQSLDLLNQRLVDAGHRPVPMDRFRPNIVLVGLQAFHEDTLAGLEDAAGHYRLDLRKPCQRCKMITIDQDSGEIQIPPHEPLRTLIHMGTSTERADAYFGQNAILARGAGQAIRLGDQLTGVAR